MTQDKIYRDLVDLVTEYKGENYTQALKKGYHYLIQLRELGLVEQDVYHKLLSIHNRFEQEQRDLMADILDFVTGWVGNPEYYIWRADEKYRKTL